MSTFILKHRERDISPIAILISFRGHRYRKNIGESVSVRQWNVKRRRARVSSGVEENTLLNESLDLWEKAADKTIAHFNERDYVPSEEEFFKILFENRFKETREHHDTRIVPYFRTFIDRYSPIRSKNRIKQYKLVLGVIERYEKSTNTSLSFEDIDMEFYSSFALWFYSHGYSSNYFGAVIRIIKAVMREAMEIDNLHKNSSFRSKNFTAPSESADSIYLNEDELLKIYGLEIGPDLVSELYPDIPKNKIAPRVRVLSKARDLFLIGAFTGLRVSDFSEMTIENVTDAIRVRTAKTGAKVVIPIHWVVREIIDRGFDFKTKMFDQKINIYIKDIARAAGISNEVIITRDVGGRHLQESHKKYELVTTHTARRSFATNAYKAGIPTISIMKITGHTRESTFMHYIRVSEEENAELLKGHDFFKKK